MATSKVRTCMRCPREMRGQGQAQVCEDCRKKDAFCKECGKPHGGPPATTKLCPQCRAIVRTKPRSERNPPWTDHEDRLLRECYATHNSHEVGPALRALFPKRPRWSITRRAQVLGACTVRTKEARWTPEEDALLKEWAWMSPERIATKLREAGYKRTLTAICIRMKRTDAREQIDGFSTRGLAKLLDVDGHAVTGWIETGLLRGERSGTTGDNHDRWHVTTEAVRAFVFAHPEKVVLSRIERAGSKLWFLSLITGGRISEDGAAPRAPAAPNLASPDRTVQLYGERVTLSALADICGRSVADLLHRIDGLGLAVQDAAFGEDVVEDVAAPSTIASTIAAQLGALARRHRANPADIAAWTGFPLVVVHRLLAGTMPLVSPALVTTLEQLDGEMEISIRPKARSYNAST